MKRKRALQGCNPPRDNLVGAHSSRWGPAREKAIIISRAGLLFTLLPHRTNRPPHALKILFCFSCAPRYPTRGRSHPPLTHNRRCTPALHSVKSRWNLRNLLGESTGFGDQRRVLPQMTTSNRHDLPSTVRTGTLGACIPRTEGNIRIHGARISSL